MKGRTYRYYTEDPLYPFGYGLSYSTFTYSNLKLSATAIEPGQQIDVTVSVKNNGPYDAEEVKSSISVFSFEIFQMEKRKFSD